MKELKMLQLALAESYLEKNYGCDRYEYAPELKRLLEDNGFYIQHDYAEIYPEIELPPNVGGWIWDTDTVKDEYSVDIIYVPVERLDEFKSLMDSLYENWDIEMNENNEMISAGDYDHGLYYNGYLNTSGLKSATGNKPSQPQPVSDEPSSTKKEEDSNKTEVKIETQSRASNKIKGGKRNMKTIELKEMMAITTIETADEFIRALSSSTIRKSVKLDMLFELNEKLNVNVAFQSENWIENRDLFLSVLDEIATPKSNDTYAHLVSDINPKWDNAVYIADKRYIQAPTYLPEARKHVVHSMAYNYRQVYEVENGELVASLEYERTNAILDTGLIQIQKRGIGYVTKEERKPVYDTKEKKFTISMVKKTYAKYQELLQNDLISVSLPEKILKDILDPSSNAGAAKVYLTAVNGMVDIFYYNRKRCGWYSVTSSKRNGYKEMPENANKKAYYAFPASPSEKRKFGLSFLYVGSDTLAEFNYRVETIINKANSNGFDFLRKVFGNDPQNYATMAKIEARLSLGLADSAPVKGPKCFAYYNGSFGENNGVEPFDGYAFVTNRYVAEFLKEAEYIIDEAKTIGLAMQGRVGFIKGYFLTIELAMLQEMVSHLDAEVIVVLAKDYAKTLATLQKGEGKKGAIYIFGANNIDPEKALKEIDFFGDKNAVKAQFDYLANSDLRILEIPAKFKNCVNTSNQILGGLMNVEGAAEVFKQIAEEHLDKIFSVEATGKITRIKQVAEINYVVLQYRTRQSQL